MAQKKFYPEVKTEDAFFVYVLEEFKSSKKISGKEALNIFTESGISNYIRNHFESLHTISSQEILADIDELISSNSR